MATLARMQCTSALQSLTATPVTPHNGTAARMPTPSVSCKRAGTAKSLQTSFLSQDLGLFHTAVHPQASRRTRVQGARAKQAVAEPPKAAGSTVDGLLDCVIVGGGVSGLCTAQALLTQHADQVPRVLVTEARERVGGNITTVSKGGYQWEEGPNSFQPGDAILRMIADSGLKDELVLGDPDAPRFVLWNKKLRPVPAKPSDAFFDLMSPWGKIRAGLGAMGLRPGPPGYEETVEQFVRRNLGAEVFERLIEPFCSGVYAGDPSKLSMKAAFGKVQRLEDIGGSIIGGSLKLLQDKKKNPPPPRDERIPKPKGQTVGSFKRGLITLPEAIAKGLGDRVKVNWKLTGMEKKSNGTLELAYDTPSGRQVVKTRTVCLTVPSYVAGQLLKGLSPAAADALSKFYYPPVGAVTISYPKSAIREECLINGELKGFGQLHPRSQGVTTLGTIYSSVLFPGRAPEDRVMLLNYIGGSLNTGIVNQTEEELVKQVDRDVRTMLIKPDAPPPEVMGVRVWPKAIPQFLVGHLETLEEARRGLKDADLDGVFLGGNYVAGVALGRCVEGAYESAQDIAKYAAKKVQSV